MIKNGRGNIFFGVVIGIFIFVMGILFIPFITDDLTTFKTAMNCAGSTITGGTMLSCLTADLVVPYLIWFLVSLLIGFLIGGT